MSLTRNLLSSTQKGLKLFVSLFVIAIMELVLDRTNSTSLTMLLKGKILWMQWWQNHGSSEFQSLLNSTSDSLTHFPCIQQWHMLQYITLMFDFTGLKHILQVMDSAIFMEDNNTCKTRQNPNKKEKKNKKRKMKIINRLRNIAEFAFCADSYHFVVQQPNLFYLQYQ